MMEFLITDFRNTRLARAMNMLLNLGALLLQTFIVIIDLKEDFVHGVKSHTIGAFCRIVSDNDTQDDKFHDVDQLTRDDECQLSMISNISLIYSILVSMADFWSSRAKIFEKSQEFYYFAETSSENELWT